MRTPLAVVRRAARPYRVSVGVAALLAFALACEDVTVTPVAVRNVAVTPTDTTLTVGDELKLAAVVTDEAGNRLADRAVTWSSENDDVVSVDATGAAVAVTSGETRVTATVDGRSGSATIQVTEPPEEDVETVEVDPDTTSIAVGDSVELTAIAKSASGTVLEGREVSWSSDDEGVATVNAEGVVTGEGAGEATIRATIDEVSGTSLVTVTEVVQPVGTVEIEPADTSITVGETAALNAIARSEDGTELGGREVSWSSDDEAVATVDAEGVVMGTGVGEATIRATIEGVSGSAQVTVSLVPVASVEIVPAEPSVLVGDTMRLEAIALAANGDTLPGRMASWSSDETSVATVDAEGLVTGIGAGDARIDATIEDASASTTVTVSLVPVASVEVAPADTTIFVGQTVQLAAIGLSAEGDTLDGRDVDWDSQDEDVATVDANGLVTAVAVGTARIEAEIEDEEGTATVTVSLVPVESVVVEPAESSIFVGDTMRLVATAFDANGDPLEGREVETWTSDDEAVATVDGQGLITGVGSGEAKITATIEGVDGAAAVTVSLVPVHSVTITPADTTLAEGDAATLHAIVLDEDGNELTDRDVAWQSSDTSVATVTAVGLLDATATAGSCPTGQVSCKAEITATADGVAGIATITVEKVAATVTVTPGGPIELDPDSVVALTALVLAADGTDLTSTKTVTWSTSDEAIAVVDPTTGQVTAVGAPCAPPQPSCSVTITATVDDASAQVEIQVLKPIASVTISPADTTLSPLLPDTATFTATLAAADGTLLPGRTTFWNWTGGTTSAPPCESDSGQVQISLNPVEGVSDANGAVSTTATDESGPLAAGVVGIWAEAEGVTGCATLRVSPL